MTDTNKTLINSGDQSSNFPSPAGINIYNLKERLDKFFESIRPELQALLRGKAKNRSSAEFIELSSDLLKKALAEDPEFSKILRNPVIAQMLNLSATFNQDASQPIQSD